MPGSIISGNVKIGNSVYLGTNSSIREKITITNSVKIGMNSSVVKNIEDPGVYVGTPSKKIKDIE
jgi:UDP-3-O-[3-hydroxymyristoyl] glucosamine N-acyltransferase